ncbi:MAG TPA: TIGR01459 family HAD-type hydrolase [Sphingomicrobium sp.]|nr:TIGR01459 family HAD-type hydrolase [Sphingomicrobium sp.]
MNLDALDLRYRLILCDIWGVVHDGVTVDPRATKRLLEWKAQGRTIVLITNAPRTAEAVEAQLDRLSLPRSAWDGVATSGEAGIAALSKLSRPPGFLGTADDRKILEGRGIILAAEGFTDVACTGLDERRAHVDAYAADLESWARDDILMHCLNPDRLVIRGGVPEPCAGALADAYEMLGGRVVWYGKPHEAIYTHAFHLAGNPPRDQIVAIGDGLSTDVLGAARQGIDCIFVTGGIHAGAPFPPDFASTYGLGDWSPVGIVEHLG